YPIIAALIDNGQLGTSASLAHVLYSEIGTLVALVTVGVIVASYYGEGATLGWRHLLAVPPAAPFIAPMIGLLFYSDPLPVVLTNVITLMANTTSFLMMLYLGMSIVTTGVRTYWQPVLASQAIKLVVAPVLAVGLATVLWGNNPTLRSVALI